MSVKIAVFAPIPSAKVSTTTAVKPGDLRSVRAPKRTSRHNVSTMDSQPPERTISLLTSRLPRSKRRSEEHTSELQSRFDLVCRLLLEKKKTVHEIVPARASRT